MKGQTSKHRSDFRASQGVSELKTCLLIAGKVCTLECNKCTGQTILVLIACYGVSLYSKFDIFLNLDNDFKTYFSIIKVVCCDAMLSGSIQGHSLCTKVRAFNAAVKKFGFKQVYVRYFTLRL